MGQRRPAFANWRSVRAWESETRDTLRKRNTLWLHGWCIGLVVLLVMWGTSHLQMVLGMDSLALRYLLTLGTGYLAFLAVLRLWAGMLVGEDPVDDASAAVDALDVGVDLATGAGRAANAALRSGRGGDFGGGGAQADFSMPGDASSLSDAASPLGDLAGGALEAAGSSDEGAVVVVPVVAVFLIGTAIVFGAGSLALLFFGWDVLLAVAVEIAFGYVSARTAVRVVREGWLATAVRLTWKPLLGALFCAVLLGGLIDIFLPTAHSLPEAMRLIF